MRTYLAGTALILAAGAGPARATTVKPMHVSEIVKTAEYVFVGTATKSASYWEDGRTTIRTYLTFTNLDVRKGKIDGDSFTIRYQGGTVGRDTIWMADFPRLQIGKRYLLYVRGNRKYESPIVGFHQGCFEVVSVGRRQTLRSMSGQTLIGVKDDRFVFLGKAPAKTAGGIATDPNFKPVPAKPNADEIEARMRREQKRGEVQNLPTEIPSQAPQSTKPVKLTPDDPGDQGPPQISDKRVSDGSERDATPVTVLPKDDDGKRITLTQFLETTAKSR